MRKVSRFYQYHGTKLLGSLSIIIPGLIAIDGLVPAENLKYWLAANVVVGALTVKRGFTNSRGSNA